jgi:hypothetical protein
MTIKESSWAHHTLVQIFLVIPWWASVGGPTLSQCTSVKHSGLSSNSMTVEATKFVEPHKSCLREYIINACCSRAQPTQSLIDTGRGYLHRCFEHENRPFSPFPSGILHFSLVAPPGLKLWHIPKANIVNHIGPPSVERALSVGVFQPLIFYR